MACACKVDRQIALLRERYGFGERKGGETSSGVRSPRNTLLNLIVIPLQIVTIPIAAGYIIYKGIIRKEPISVRKLANVRN